MSAWPQRLRGAAGLWLATTLLGCLQAGPPSFAPTRDACKGLSNVFYLVAHARDRGASREELVEQLAETLDSAFIEDPKGTEASLHRVVDYVYRDPKSSPERLAAQVRSGCTVSDEGEALLSLARPLR